MFAKTSAAQKNCISSEESVKSFCFWFFAVDCDAMHHWFILCRILLPWVWIEERIETDILHYASLRQLVAKVGLSSAHHHHVPITLRYPSHSHWKVNPSLFFWKHYSKTTAFRYIAICHPFLLQQERLKPNRTPAAGAQTQSQQSSASNGMSLKKRTCLYMLPVILISFLVNIPKFMEFRNSSR